MKISATSSGGFAGLSEHYEVDTQVHPHGGAIEAVLASLAAQAVAASAPHGADMRHWRISVESPGGRQSISLVEDGSAASARWQELIAYLRQPG